MTEQPPKTGSARNGLIGCLALVAIAAGACGLIASYGERHTRPTGTEAEVMCESYVKDQLKSPGSAKFSEENATEAGAGGTWVVSGAVDSQNSFGGLVRIQFTCTVKPRPDGNTWDLVSLTGLTN